MTKQNLQGRKKATGINQKVDLKSSFLKIFQRSRPYKKQWLLAILFTLSATVLSLITPTKLSELTNMITDGIKFGMNFPAVSRAALILISLYGISWMFNVAQSWLMAAVTQRFSQDLRQQIMKKINCLPMAYFHKTVIGDTLSRMTNDVDTLGQSLSQVVSMLANSILMLIGSLVFMLLASPVMAVVVVAVGLLSAFLMSQITKKSQPYFISQQKDLGALNGYMEEIYTGHMIVKSFHQEEESAKTFERLNQNLLRDGFYSQSLSVIMVSISSFISNLSYVAVCVVGGILTYRGFISIGTIIAFLAYITYFTQPISFLSQVMQIMQSAAAAGDRIFAFLEETELTKEYGNSFALSEPSGQVTFEHVTFGYHEGTPVIQDFSAQIEAGQKIAIVGPTGAGKTTLVNLLMRFYDIDTGSIRLDDVDIRELSREQVHDYFSMVLQNTWLFKGTLRENLVFNTSGITDRKLDDVIKAVGLDYFVGTLSNGYDTMLDSSANLSQGQCQQIAIARAMLEKRPMLILDEATSSVDTRTESIIQSAMDKLMEGRTSFVIAHRLSTIQNADCILVLKDGNIVESGTHEELLKKNGFYAELYLSQFEQQSSWHTQK